MQHTSDPVAEPGNGESLPALLDELEGRYARDPEYIAEAALLAFSETVARELGKRDGGWRRLQMLATQTGLPIKACRLVMGTMPESEWLTIVKMAVALGLRPSIALEPLEAQG